MIPWLLLQGLLGILLAGLALYYLIIFPDKSDCAQYVGINQKQAVNNQYHPYRVSVIYDYFDCKLILILMNIYFIIFIPRFR